MELKREIIDDVFTALDRQIGLEGGKQVRIVVIGGTALAALGLVIRTTKDVDVLGEASLKKGSIRIRKMKDFPEYLKRAASKVQRDFNLPENWLNLGPASQLELGLPEGFESRLIRKKYGDYLTVYFASRIDLIHLKLFAAVDRDDYHIQDLLALKPSEEEIEKAVRWVLTQDISEGFRRLLKKLLEEIGHGKIAKRI